MHVGSNDFDREHYGRGLFSTLSLHTSQRKNKFLKVLVSFDSIPYDMVCCCSEKLMGHCYCRVRMGKTDRAQGGPDFAPRTRTVTHTLNALETMHISKIQLSKITFLVMVLVRKRKLVS